MPLLLRVLRNKNKWLAQDPEWLQKGDVPADPIACLKTDQNTLSVFSIKDDRANLSRVLAAYAAKRQQVAQIDFALFNENKIREKGYKMASTKGNTPDRVVNDWHIEIQELSGSYLVELAKILKADGEFERCLPAEVRKLITDNVHAKNIEPDDLTPNILDSP